MIVRLDRNEDRLHAAGVLLPSLYPPDQMPWYLKAMAWRLVAVLLVLTGTAWSAPIVIKCYDGSSSAIVRWPNRSGTRLGVCDLDHSLDGRCQFRVSLGATGKTVPGVFNVVLHVGRRKRVQYVDTTAVLKCRPGPEPPPPPPPPPPPVSPPPGAVTYVCQDAILVDSSTDPVCDVDQACDHTCTFGFHCPTCCGCLAPCFEFGTPYRIPVPVGRREVLPACERGGRPALVLECRAHPSGVACPTTTTTTLPVGSCLTDADCAIFPPECQHCELGDCEGFPTINPNGSISGVVCPIPR